MTYSFSDASFFGKLEVFRDVPVGTIIHGEPRKTFFAPFASSLRPLR